VRKFTTLQTKKQNKEKPKTNHSSLFNFKRISSNVFKTSERENLLNFEKTTNKQTKTDVESKE
jgi:hypothetical protein